MNKQILKCPRCHEPMLITERGVMIDRAVLPGNGVKIIEHNCTHCGDSYMAFELVPDTNQP